jgi:hypothetical protein
MHRHEEIYRCEWLHPPPDPLCFYFVWVGMCVCVCAIFSLTGRELLRHLPDLVVEGEIERMVHVGDELLAVNGVKIEQCALEEEHEDNSESESDGHGSSTNTAATTITTSGRSRSSSSSSGSSSRARVSSAYLARVLSEVDSAAAANDMPLLLTFSVGAATLKREQERLNRQRQLEAARLVEQRRAAVVNINRICHARWTAAVLAQSWAQWHTFMDHQDWAVRC